MGTCRDEERVTGTGRNGKEECSTVMGLRGRKEREEEREG